MLAEGATCHEIIDEDHLVVVVAVSDEGDAMEVSELREHLDLIHELVRPLLCEALDGDQSGTAVDVALVHMAESPDADDEDVVEVVGGGFHLGEGEVGAEIGR
ncbi:hypothetical protein Fmac_014653 [Flemingia macrophylla]|uniref:Uncharacterized protein n=1 Tax=Flemingia macrophylla TaxID=520843 RepID=A0ABD1MEB3_9FABA